MLDVMIPLNPRRRRFLAALGTVCTASIAGCSGGDENGDTTTETTTPSTTTTSTKTTTSTPHEQAVEHYEDAIDALAQNKEILDEWAASSYESSMVGTLQDRLATARDDLAAAEDAADPSGELAGQIDQARNIADFQELNLAYYEGVNALFQVISDAKSLGDNELHQRAADKFVDAQELLQDIRMVLDDMGTALDQIDNDALDEPALEYTGEPLDHLDLEDRRAIDGTESYLVGYENVNLAFVQLEIGQGHYEEVAYAEARGEWETGRERAAAAETSFGDAIDNDYTPQNLHEESMGMLGAAKTIIEAFDKFVKGAEEAEAGNVENGDNLVLEGFGILEEL